MASSVGLLLLLWRFKQLMQEDALKCVSVVAVRSLKVMFADFSPLQRLSAPLLGNCCTVVALCAKTLSKPGRGLPFSLWSSALSTPNWFFESFFHMCLHLCCCCSPAFGEEPPRNSLARRRPSLTESCHSILTDRSREPAPTTTLQTPGDQLGPHQHVQGGGQRLPKQKFPQQRFSCQA